MIEKQRIDFSYLAAIVITVGGILLFVSLFFEQILVTVLPFFIAWGLAFIVRPAACAIGRRTGISQRIASVILTVLAFLLIGAGVFLILNRLWHEAGTLLIYLSEHPERLSALFERITALLSDLRELIPGGGGESFISEEDLIGMASEGLASALGMLSRAVGSVLLRLPSVLFFCIITVIAAVYFALDLGTVNRAILELFPERIRRDLVSLKEGVIRGIGIYLRSYAVLYSLTFAELIVGFLLLGIPYAWLIAFLAATVDLLPILGVGTVLVPWGIISCLFGNTRLGLCLLALWLVIAVVRQIVEPHLIGTHLGLHPLLTLFSMYTGYVLLGIGGMLIGPLAAALIRAASQRIKNREKG